MNFLSVNVWAVLVSAVAAIAIGSVWYGPLFGGPFMKASGMDKVPPEKAREMKKKMWVPYTGQFLASLLTMAVLDQMIVYNGLTTVVQGMSLAFFLWLGFVMPVQFGQQLWGGKKILFFLGAGNMLLTMLAGGAILGVWR